MQRYSKLWSVLVFGPLLLAPILAVEFPRVLAYLPLVSLVFGGVILWREKASFFIPKKAIMVLIAVLAFLSFNVFVLAPSEIAIERFEKLFFILGFGAIFLYILFVGRNLMSQDIIKWLMICCSIGAAITCFEVLSNAALYQIIRPEVSAQEYGLAVFNRGSLVITLLSLLVLFVVRGTQHKAFYLLFLPVLVMLLLVESQSAQITAVAGLIFFFFFPINHKWAWQAFFLLFVVGVLAKPFLVQTAYKNLPENINEQPLLHEAYVGHRIEIWDFVARKALEKPFVGHGLEFTRDYDYFETPQRFLASNSILHPHSVILQIWIEMGLLGVIGSLMLSGFLIMAMFKISDPVLRKASLSLFAVILLVSCFSYGMWQGWWLGLFFIISGIILSNLPTEEHKA